MAKSASSVERWLRLGDDAFQFIFFSLGFWIMWEHYLVKEIFFLQYVSRSWLCSDSSKLSLEGAEERKRGSCVSNHHQAGNFSTPARPSGVRDFFKTWELHVNNELISETWTQADWKPVNLAAAPTERQPGIHSSPTPGPTSSWRGLEPLPVSTDLGWACRPSHLLLVFLWSAPR